MKQDTTEISYVERLRADIEIAKRKKLLFDKIRRVVPVTGVGITLLMLLIYYSNIYKEPWVLVVGAFYLLIALIYPLYDAGKSIATEIEGLESELALNQTGTEAIEQRAERLFKSHEIDLKKYYDQSLRQNGVIFLTGIFCILVGFAFIGLSFYLIYKEKANTAFEEKVLIGSIGTISGVLTNFVAVIFLRMYSDTVSSFTAFHQKLVTTNHLHFANFLASKISDRPTMDATLKELAGKITEKVEP